MAYDCKAGIPILKYLFIFIRRYDELLIQRIDELTVFWRFYLIRYSSVLYECERSVKIMESETLSNAITSASIHFQIQQTTLLFPRDHCNANVINLSFFPENDVGLRKMTQKF